MKIKTVITSSNKAILNDDMRNFILSLYQTTMSFLDVNKWLDDVVSIEITLGDTGSEYGSVVIFTYALLLTFNEKEKDIFEDYVNDLCAGFVVYYHLNDDSIKITFDVTSPLGDIDYKQVDSFSEYYERKSNIFSEVSIDFKKTITQYVEHLKNTSH